MLPLRCNYIELMLPSCVLFIAIFLTQLLAMYLVSAMRLPLVRSMCSLAQESDKQRKTPLKYLIEICAFYILAWAWPRWWNRRSYDCKRHLLDPVGGQIGSFYLKCPVRSPSPCLVFLVFTLPPARPHLCPLRHYTGSVSSYYINDHSELLTEALS